jgi:preprotein translocase subunit SecE
MWGFESLLPCQFRGATGRGRGNETQTGGRMAEAAKLRQESAGSEGSSLSVPGWAGRVAEYPRRLRQFFHEVRVEMRQVNWPTRQDVWSTTMVVTVTVTFFGIFFFVVDKGFAYLAQWGFRLFSK